MRAPAPTASPGDGLQAKVPDAATAVQLTACPACKHQVSKQAISCPSCGHLLAPPPQQQKTDTTDVLITSGWVIAVGGGVLTVVSFLGAEHGGLWVLFGVAMLLGIGLIALGPIIEAISKR